MANFITDQVKVKLVGTMPRKSYTDIAGAITRSELEIDEILEMPYNDDLVNKIVNMSHLATTEFDYFVFMVEGVSRVTEIQLVRKRLASYMIKSGRINKKGKRSFDIICPKSISDLTIPINVADKGEIQLSYKDICNMINDWYDKGVELGYPEEDLRYLKPQATEAKILVAMNAHALLDWFKIRCCKNAQWEIREMAKQMLKLCKEHNPTLFQNAGASCVGLGYCPENDYQNKVCKGKIVTHKDVLELIKNRK